MMERKETEGRESLLDYGRIELHKYIMVSIWFGCNNHCSICMLSDMKGRLAPIGFDAFRQALLLIRRKGVFDNLILSGAEVTTCPDPQRYVE